MTRLLPILALAALAGCSANTDGIAAAKVALTGAEVAAKNYVTLPLCPSPAPCSDATVSTKIKTADTAAYNAVKGLDSGASTLTVATQAVADLVSLIPVKK